MKEINLNVPIECLASLSTIMIRKIGAEEFYNRIKMNDDTFNEFPLNLKQSYIHHLRYRTGIEISNKLFFEILRKSRAPSLIRLVILRCGMTKRLKPEKWEHSVSEESAQKLFSQVTVEDVQKLVKLKYGWGCDSVYKILAAHIKREFVPLLLKIPEATEYIEQRLKGEN